MMVTDLQHFVDLPADVPGPARSLADQLHAIIRAATAEKAGMAWETAIACKRRPGRQRCPGHIQVFRADLPAPIEWRCSSCADEGVISNWEGSYSDLRLPRGERAASQTDEVVISEEAFAALRDLQLLDADCERLVYRARATERGVVLRTDAGDLDELMGFVAAEANHESNPRRRRRLDAAFDALYEAFKAMDE
ncbi:MAG: hypothetical protein HYX32_09305 [Actinobacteria bacterium]|nr:hypothetical protein [Actinomycetota bacterium]